MVCSGAEEKHSFNTGSSKCNIKLFVQWAGNEMDNVVGICSLTTVSEAVVVLQLVDHEKQP